MNLFTSYYSIENYYFHSIFYTKVENRQNYRRFTFHLFNRVALIHNNRLSFTFHLFNRVALIHNNRLSFTFDLYSIYIRFTYDSLIYFYLTNRIQ